MNLKTPAKYLIPDNDTKADVAKEHYWEKVHNEENYETVWSMTEDAGVRQKIIDEISVLPRCNSILIPGCGSRTFLQNDLAKIFSDTRILCTDFAGVIELAKTQANADNIEYAAKDSKALGYENEWDVIVIVNSILSANDQENRDILKSCYQALKPGGVIMGFFPTIFASIDITTVGKKVDLMQFVDIENSSFFEEKQSVRQIFYTPLRLRLILKEAGFIREKMEIYFCDSEYFTNHTHKYYGIDDEDLPIYEHFVVAHK